MAKRYRPWTPAQSYLLPPSPAEWLPENHLAYFVLDTLDELDLGAIERALQAKDPRGERSQFCRSTGMNGSQPVRCAARTLASEK